MLYRVITDMSQLLGDDDLGLLTQNQGQLGTILEFVLSIVSEERNSKYFCIYQGGWGEGVRVTDRLTYRTGTWIWIDGWMDKLMDGWMGVWAGRREE